MGRGLAIIVFVLSVASAALAQQAAQVDAQTRQQVDAFVQRYNRALSDSDWATLSSLYVPGALVVTPLGKLQDGKTDSHIADHLHKMGFKETSQVEDVQPVFGGQGLLVIAGYTVTFAADRNIPPSHGYDLFLLKKAGNEWKMRANSATNLVPTAPAPK